ncbi:MAG: biopolymer transporter ExbD [Lentisphaerae bacterium]|nr:biopolymer transporter ExbD [Lentisphaerota bacterium]
MTQRERVSVLSASGLRTRFLPRSRLNRGLIGAAPWVDIVLLLIFFLLVDSKLVLQPGVRVDLPRAPFREGAAFGMTAVVLSVGGEGGARREIVFFDDERFLVSDENQMRGLRSAFASRARRQENPGLIIQADKSVRHGTVVNVMNMALEAGVEQVTLAVEPF